jgi:hypothetical protein
VIWVECPTALLLRALPTLQSVPSCSPGTTTRHCRRASAPTEKKTTMSPIMSTTLPIRPRRARMPRTGGAAR